MRPPSSGKNKPGSGRQCKTDGVCMQNFSNPGWIIFLFTISPSTDLCWQGAIGVQGNEPVNDVYLLEQVQLCLFRCCQAESRSPDQEHVLIVPFLVPFCPFLIPFFLLPGRIQVRECEAKKWQWPCGKAGCGKRSVAEKKVAKQVGRQKLSGKLWKVISREMRKEKN